MTEETRGRTTERGNSGSDQGGGKQWVTRSIPVSQLWRRLDHAAFGREQHWKARS